MNPRDGAASRKAESGPPIFHMVPYLMTVAASFTWSVLEDEPSPGRTLLKCLPVLYLALYLGMTEEMKGEPRQVLPALLFSAFGDALMSYPDIWFLEGVEAFAFAQVMYSVAFGFKNTRIWTAVGLYAMGSILLVFILPHVSTTLMVAFSIYSLIIWTTLWRAADRFSSLKPVMPFEQRLSTVIGAAFFVISDSCIVFLQMFKLLPPLQARVIVMSTYYMAQLLLTLGSANKFWGLKSSGARPAASKDD